MSGEKLLLIAVLAATPALTLAPKLTRTQLQRLQAIAEQPILDVVAVKPVAVRVTAGEVPPGEWVITGPAGEVLYRQWLPAAHEGTLIQLSYTAEGYIEVHSPGGGWAVWGG